MFLVTVICTDPGCLAELDLVVEEPDAAAAVCCDGCGCCVMLLSVSEWEPAASPSGLARALSLR